MFSAVDTTISTHTSWVIVDESVWNKSTKSEINRRTFAVAPEAACLIITGSLDVDIVASCFCFNGMYEITMKMA